MVSATIQTQPDINQVQRPPYGNAPTYIGIDASEFMKELISNDNIPEEIIKGASFWTAFGRSTKLSFLDFEDITYLMLQFEILLVRFKQDIPKIYVTPRMLSTLTNIKMEYYVNLCRARGNGTINERMAITVSSNASFTDRPIEKPSINNPGILSRLANSITGRR